jgi:hypothetical protein
VSQGSPLHTLHKDEQFVMMRLYRPSTARAKRSARVKMKTHIRSQKENDEPLVCSPEQAGALMGGVPGQTIRRWCKRGLIPSIKIGRLVFIPLSGLKQRFSTDSKAAA